METRNEPVERTIELEGPAAFMDVVYETIQARISRTREEYGEIITGIDAVDAGDVDREATAVLHLYVPGDTDPDEAIELVNITLDRIADENEMDLARHGVQVQLLDEE